MVDIIEDALCPMIDALTRLARHHAAGGSVKKCRRQRFFQHADTLGDVGWRHTQACCRA